MKLQQIKPMEFNYFKGNKLLTFDKDLITFVEYDIDEKLGDFVIGKSTFEMMKKLVTNQTIKVTNSIIVICSNEGTYRSALINPSAITIPDTKDIGQMVEIIHVEQETLRNAIKFVSPNKMAGGCICGVLINKQGSIYATDDAIAIRLSLGDFGTVVSIPAEAINALPTAEEAQIYVTERIAVLSINGLISVYTRLFTGIPRNLDPIFNKISKNENECEVDVNCLVSKLKMFPVDVVKFTYWSDAINITLDDFETSISANCILRPTMTDEGVEVPTDSITTAYNYKSFLTILSCLKSETATIRFTKGSAYVKDDKVEYLIASVVTRQ